MKQYWLLILLGSLCPSLYAQDACVRARTILEKVNKQHAEQKIVDDKLSAEIFSEFFRKLDPLATLLLSTDTGKLVSYRNKLDDGNDPVCSLLIQATVVYKKKLEWYKTFIDSLLSKPLDFSKVEYVPNITSLTPAFCNKSSELKDRIVKEMKLKILLNIYRHVAVDSNILTKPDAFVKAEQNARQRVKKTVLVDVERLLKDPKLLTAEVNENYLKAIPAVFDPHSAFFSKEELSRYSEHLNPSALSFGITLEESPTGEVSIANIIPGSPAWNSNQVHKGDIPLSIRWKPSNERIDLVELDIDAIEDILDERAEKTCELTIRKATGETRIVKLVKEKIENEDNIVSGFVLKGKESKRSIGYISLPAFFTDADPKSGGCATAVTKEIIKLKGESIEGLILDLRFNGGGSLYEAMELVGLFIDVGPVAVFQERNEVPITIKDMNRGTVYDGPLLVMVNGASASASEVVAAALQDYRRAIIAGSQTYGKATGQIVELVDDNNPALGHLKLTEARIYRITGKSHQKVGVTPDYLLNDLSSVVYHREEYNANALMPRDTEKKLYYTPSREWFEKDFQTTYLKSIDETKLKARERDYAATMELEKTLKMSIPLERKAFIAHMKKMEASTKNVEEDVTANNLYSVLNSKYDETVFAVDAYHREVNKGILDQVSESIYIKEAYRVLDYAITQKK